jgi:drug/metabolite transporter (DMT)-like permease
MRSFLVIGFLTLMLFDTASQIGFKLVGTDLQAPQLSIDWIVKVISDKWTYLSIAGYIGAFIVWMTMLKRVPVGPAFAGSHLHLVSVLIICYLYFHESFSTTQILGSILIMAGILLLGLTEKDEKLNAAC